MVIKPAEQEIEMFLNIKYLATALLAAMTFPAWAGHDNDRYQEPVYDYAKVVDVQPVIEIVQIPEDRQVCREQPV